MESQYEEISARVKAVDANVPSPLRTALTELFVNHPAMAPHDLCSPATAKMIRYRLSNGKILCHQIETSPQYLWFAVSQPIPPSAKAHGRRYAADEGRHSNTNPMPDLGGQADMRLTVLTVSQAETLLNELLS